jgi:hypothetical protein
MKSPRDILLEQHHDQSPALDKIRERVVGEQAMVPGQTHPAFLAAFRAWLTLSRATWGSLAAAWVVIIALNISANAGDESDAPVRSHADAREVLEGVREYQLKLALLLLDQESVEEQNQMAEPKNPGPRSEAARPRRNAQIQPTTLYA